MDANGRVVYQITPTLDKAALVRRGMARYVMTDRVFDPAFQNAKDDWVSFILSLLPIQDAEAKKKKRQRYIVKKAADVQGIFKTNLVISQKDAHALETTDQGATVLKKCRVVVVVSSGIGGVEGAISTPFIGQR